MNQTNTTPQKRRREFVLAAQELFFTKGYERTSVNDIIAAVGVSKGAFYHYFDSKGGVLQGVIKALNDQFLEAIRAIVANEALNTISKWNQIMQVGGNWNVDQKDELQATSRVMRMDGNLPLRDRLQSERTKLFSLECSPVVVGGIQEGVFETSYPEDTTEYAYIVMTNASDAFFEILLNPDVYKYPLTSARTKLKAAQTAVERLLGASPNSIQFVEERALIAWFEN